jgi:hypothetical protein
MIYECEDVIRTIDDHIDLFESIGVLLREKNGFIKSDHRYFNLNSYH